MTETLLAFFLAYRVFIIGIASLMLLVLMLRNQSIRFWIMDFWYQVVMIRKLAKDPTQSPKNQWRTSENDLCSAYAAHIKKPLNEEEYLDRIDYLAAAYDLGRKPLSLNIKALIIFLSFLEALGFAFMLSSGQFGESSSNAQTGLAIAIAAILGIVFPIFMHRAGHSLHRTKVLRDALKSFKENGGKTFDIAQVSLAENKADRRKNHPHYLRCASRVKESPQDEGGFLGSVLIIVAVLGIAIGTAYLRINTFENIQNKETILQPQSASNPFGTPGGLSLPEEITKPQAEASQKARQEISDTDVKTYIAGAIILAIIYIVTQGVGLLMGYIYGFAGRDSEAAFEETMGCSTFKDYRDKLRPRIMLAEARLAELQRRLAEKSHREIQLICTFPAYLRWAYTEEDKPDDKPVDTSTVTDPQPEFAMKLNLDSAKAHLAGLTDKQAQQDYYRGLSDELQAKLKPWLKQRKVDETTRQESASKAQQQAELDELF